MVKLAVANKDIQVLSGARIQENEVGIIKSRSKEGASVFFIPVWDLVELSNLDYTEFDPAKTGDAYTKKICNVCHKLLPTNLFEKNQNGKGDRSVRRPSCKTCRRTLEGMKLDQKVRKEWSMNKPNNVEFECPVCGKRTIAGVTSKLVIDHDHKTGSPRSWICDSCNTGIGRFKDDIAILERAIKYLR